MEFNEKVHVFARSMRGRIEPLQFMFKNQRFQVREIVEARRESESRRTFFHFTVNLLPYGVCKLFFELHSGEWFLLHGELPKLHDHIS